MKLVKSILRRFSARTSALGNSRLLRRKCLKFSDEAHSRHRVPVRVSTILSFESPFMLPHCSRKRDVCLEPLSFVANFGISENQSMIQFARIFENSKIGSYFDIRNAEWKRHQASRACRGCSAVFTAKSNKTQHNETINSNPVFL